VGILDFFRKRNTKEAELHKQPLSLSIQKSMNDKPKKRNPSFISTINSEQYGLLSDFEDRYYDKALSISEKYEIICDEIADIYSIDKRLKHCEKAIAAFYSFKEFCVSRGKGGELFFMQWLHETNSDYSDLTNIDNLKQETSDLTHNRDACIARLNNAFLISEYGSVEEGEKAIAEEKERNERLKKLRKDIVSIVKKTPGILQKDIYPLLADFSQSEIRREIEAFLKQEKLKREKKGSTYELHIK
jgi:septum formation topological specificity factor MinE